MLNFDEAKVLREHRDAVGLIDKAAAVADEICRNGYENLFYIGIGGTVLYANQMASIVKQCGSKLPLYVENAADFCVIGNPNFSDQSVVVVESVTGNTPEMVEAVQQATDKGAAVIGYIENTESPLAQLCDHLLTGTEAAFYFWYTITMRFLYHAGDYPDYDRLMQSLRAFPENAVRISKEADEKARRFAQAYKDEPIHYLIGAGNLEDWATCYGMCIMEEMQWMKTKSVSASNFFHGTLEVIERDVSVILIKGEDKARPLTDRVERFVHRVSAKVTVFDTKDYELDGVEEEFRWILAPLVMRTVFKRVSVHLEHERRHPLAIRRYYRRLDY